MRRSAREFDESDVRIRPSRRGSRPRTKDRPKHEDAVTARVVSVDRGRWRTLLAEGTAQQRLAAEQELIRLKAQLENGEQRRLLLEEELGRLQEAAAEAARRRAGLEEEAGRLRELAEIGRASCRERV